MKLDINKILRATPRNSSRGAPMGDTDHIAYPACVPPLRCQRIQLVDGDYGPDGTYWGASSPLWCAFNGDNDEYAAGQGTRIYVRALTREGAKQALMQLYANVWFRKE
jgi:hypothetical protein